MSGKRISNVMFEKLKEFSNEEVVDTRFYKGKCWIMHLENNRNDSYFEKDVVEAALPTLANTPILAYYTKNSEGEEDFGGHEYKLSSTDNGYELICEEYAIGVITETDAKEAKFEDRLCDDGIVRTFVTCPVTLWTKFNKSLNIFEKQNVKQQSMEIADYEGYFDKQDRTYHFTKFNFNGCTVLGDDLTPAMVSASLEVDNSTFSTSEVAKDIQYKLNQFNQFFEKEDDSLLKNEKEPVINEENPQVKEENGAEGENFSKKPVVEEPVVEEPVVEEPVFNSNPVEEPKPEEPVVEEPKPEEKFTLTFSLSYEDIRSKLYSKLYEIEDINNSWCYILPKTHEDYFIYSEEKWNGESYDVQYWKQGYAIEDESIIFNSEREELYSVMVGKDVYDQIKDTTYSALVEKVEKLEAENGRFTLKVAELEKQSEKLAEFEAKEKESQIEECLSKFSMVDDLDIAMYKDKFMKNELTLEQVEDKLYAEVGRKNFSKVNEKPKEEKQPSFNFSIENENEGNSKCPYNGLEKYFVKKDN